MLAGTTNTAPVLSTWRQRSRISPRIAGFLIFLKRQFNNNSSVRNINFILKFWSRRFLPRVSLRRFNRITERRVHSGLFVVNKPVFGAIFYFKPNGQGILRGHARYSAGRGGDPRAESGFSELAILIRVHLG